MADLHDEKQTQLLEAIRFELETANLIDAYTVLSRFAEPSESAEMRQTIARRVAFRIKSITKD